MKEILMLILLILGVISLVTKQELALVNLIMTTAILLKMSDDNHKYLKK